MASSKNSNKNTSPAPIAAPPVLDLKQKWMASTVIQAASDAALSAVASDDQQRIYQTPGKTVIVKTDKDVYVNTYEQVTEQKYITTGEAGVTSIVAGTNVSISSTGLNGTGVVTINSSGGGNPGGCNTQVQFNCSGSFSGSNGLTYNYSTNTLTATNLVATSSANLGAIGSVTITGGSSGQVLCTNGSGSLGWTTVSGGASPATPTSLGTVFGYTTGFGNTAIGCCAGNINQNCFASDNTAIGYCALKNNQGYGNVAIGREALRANTQGYLNIAIGFCSMWANTCGNSNIAMGIQALGCNTIGDNNIALGGCSLIYNTSGNSNIALGFASLLSNSTGGNNIGIGCCALQCNLGAWNNVAIGAGALSRNTAGCDNIALGCASLFFNTSGRNNIGIGCGSLYQNTTGSDNTAIGLGAMAGNRTGINNIAIGCIALFTNCSGSNNTAMGYGAMYGLNGGNGTSGSNNISIGERTLYNNRSGNHNVAQGCRALYANTTGNCNIAIGALAGCNITTGGNNTIIGSLPGSAGLVCTVLIGAGTCERIKVDNTGLCINGGSLFTNNGSAIYIKNTYEAIVPLSGATGVVTHDFSQGSIFNHTSIAGDFTANFTNLNLTSGNATNAVLILNQGGTPYLPTAVQIGGVAQTINWQGGSPPTGNASQKDVVSFSITNISSTYTVFGQLVTFA